ncbi:kinase-like domain-containing protein [Podospora didyma]|uniref:non-specific serine/threonine protein kinase n=1 Tax=Podospora didyma TaxID=330526 RepID=A0AAE0NTF1_9PEZI|nr:kinase-like domain-containing protein [Podospora didyma]
MASPDDSDDGDELQDAPGISQGPGRRYVSIRTIFISWAVDQGTEYVDEVRKAARKMVRVGELDEIQAGPKEGQFHRDVKARLSASNAAFDLIVVVYLGGIQYLGGISARHSTVAHIRPLKSTTLLWGAKAGSMYWDMQDFLDTEADVLFITNFASRDFRRCLSRAATRSASDGVKQHCLQLLTFNSNDPKRFAESLSRFTRGQSRLERSSPLLGCSIADACHDFDERDSDSDRDGSSDWLTKIFAVKTARAKSKPSLVRRDILSGAVDIWLARPYPIFGPEHVKLSEPDGYHRRARQMKIKPTGSHAQIWIMALDYRPNPSDPGTFNTVFVVVKRFLPPPDVNNTVETRAFERVFELERRNLIEMMKRPHPNILAILGSFELPHRESFNLIFPYARGRDLFTFMRLSKETQNGKARLYPSAPLACNDYGPLEHGVLEECIGLLDAVSYLHDPGNFDGKIILHRDIKPANIFIHDRKFKLADFGIARIKSSVTASKTQGWIGTEEYSPPELFDPSAAAEGMSDKFGRTRDVWGLGCVLLELAVMLAATSRNDHIPSVERFEHLRVRSSEHRGNQRHNGDDEDSHGEPGTKTFAKTMDCVRSTARLVTDLGDSHLTCLVETAMAMLEVDCKKRPVASRAHEHMKASHATLLREEFHSSLPDDPDASPPTTHSGVPGSRTNTHQVPSSADPNNPGYQSFPPAPPDNLAQFWYMAFWHNDPVRSYYDVVYLANVILSVVIIPVIVGIYSITSMLADMDTWKPDQSTFIGTILMMWSIIQVPLSGFVWYFLSHIIFIVVPCYLLKRFIMWEAERYVSSYPCTISSTATSNNCLGEDYAELTDYEFDPYRATTITEAEGTTRNISSLLPEIEDVEVDDRESDSLHELRWRQRRRQRRNFADGWRAVRTNARAGTRAGKAAAAWAQKRVFKSLWQSLVFIQTQIDQVANYSARMERERGQRRRNQGQVLRTGAVAL